MESTSLADRQEWYIRRYRDHNRYHIDWANSYGVNALVKKDYNEVKLAVGTPLVFLPNMFKMEDFRIMVADWEDDLVTEDVIVGCQPMKIFCFCNHYGRNFATITIRKMNDASLTSILGLQTAEAILVTTNKGHVEIPDRANLIFNRLRRRQLTVVDRVVRHGIDFETFRDNTFCAGNHEDLGIFKNFCTKCSGHIRSDLPGVRPCTCVYVGGIIEERIDSYTSDDLLQEFPYERLALRRG